MVPVNAVDSAGRTAWTNIPGECRAVGFAGTLPPGARLVAIGMDDYGMLKTSLVAYPMLHELMVSPDRLSSQAYDAGAALLCRGQVHDFGRTLAGVAVALVWPYMLTHGWASLVTGLLALESTIGAGFTAPRRSPLAVIYSEPPAVGEIPFTKGLISFKEIGPAAVLSTVAPSVMLPPDAESVLVHFTDNAADAEIVGAETGDFETHWAMLSGSTGFMYAHCHDDDFDAAGLGSVVRLNNGALFTVPKGAVGITIIQPTTVAAFWLNYYVR
jgi:hypothetical protein